MFNPSLLLLLLVRLIDRAQSVPDTLQKPFSLNLSPWTSLESQVEGRLFQGNPFASPCFADHEHGRDILNSTACKKVRESYVDEVSRTNEPGAYINSQWETCQLSGDQCLLDYTDPMSDVPCEPSHTCKLGSVPDRFVDVQKPEDVTAAFNFSRSTGIPIVIKNTGHDYKGRSSGPGSLALWTHNLKSISYDANFIPEGCSVPTPGVTIGAGVQWGDAYAFAEAHNITVVGGSDRSVGVAGGWLQGGGHGLLSNTMGLGVDRVLQYKVVTPDGEYRVANACQNEDLFFALRGGGGGTFGVVLESTIIASPQITLQVILVSLKEPNSVLTKSLWSILVDNGLTWANEGWGGLSNAQVAAYVNPKLNKVDAEKSMNPLISFGKQLGDEALVIVKELPSWGSFFEMFAHAYVADVGSSLALTSRLIPKANFQNETSRSMLTAALLSAEADAPGVIILATPPVSFPGDPGATSVTEAWRDAIYHVTVVSQWNWNATIEDKRGKYAISSNAVNHLRQITPDAAYSNEADVHEPNHEVAFWGTNYPRLLSIKQKYDPEHLLDCWHCVGWNPQSSRFSCYL